MLTNAGTTCSPVVGIRAGLSYTEKKEAQQRAVDAVVPRRGRARECRERLHPHVARHDLIQLVVEVQLAGCVGVHDKVGPKFVTERSTHLLGNADEQPASALVCALACHLGQLTRWAGWYARRR